jgi:hypothetical protein
VSGARDSSLDFQCTHQANVDPDIAEALQTNYRMPGDTSEAALFERAQMLHRVAWQMVAVRNQRVWMRDYRVREARRQVLMRAKFTKAKIREADFQQDEQAIATRLAKLEAEIRVDAEMAGHDPDVVMAQVQAEAQAVNTGG